MQWGDKLRKYGLYLIGILFAVSACGLFSKDKPPPPTEPTRVVIEFEAAGNLNPNIDGRPSPVEVRIYHLRSYSAFKEAGFMPLFDGDQKVLGKELVQKQVIYLKPDEKHTVFFETAEDIRTLGILAAFREYDRGRWKVATGLQKNKTNVVDVFIAGTTLQIR
jgi:type VI secretion system protein VasD